LPQQANEYDEFINVPPQLSFTPKEEVQGRELLASMGVAPDTRYICFHARDKAYLDSLYRGRSREEGAYHDYKDCDVNNYLPAAEHLAGLGYTALRMGEIVEQEFLAVKHNRIVDYASQFQSGFGDIYLLAHCAFFLGNVSGLWVVASCFNTPIAIANVIPLVFVPMRSDGLFIPKKLWDIRRKRFLTFREILMCGADEWLRTEKYTQAGVEAVENTTEEILSLGKEMHERLEGKWISTEEDEDLQARYRSLFLPEHRCYGFPSRIGAEFLRQNQDLLV
jgi:putative glycosyltransferase (TIGR04372 family)